ncbi:hypothetical protein ZOSMA_151G00300 [Zostera marina]|uniref:SWIM-type domain-containing protein n=1 Tax=Zostera marina TaxID=29655 RepID=A0A0K9PYA5_ZOSMR|nr:hypothetical protein ZOSMA_151G00300 [Zostera marina]
MHPNPCSRQPTSKSLSLHKDNKHNSLLILQKRLSQIGDYCQIQSNPNTETIGSSTTPYFPEVGQLFSTHDEARDAYMGYAGNIGFNVRIGSTKINDQVMVGRRILCSKQGYALTTATDNIVNEKKHRRIRNSRSRCLSMIYISLNQSSNLWRVVNFIQDHNHPLVTPSKKRYLPIFDAVSIGSFEVSGTIHVGEEGVFAKCTCRLFESFEIPCRHLICYLTLNNISVLPETLVCNRWRAIQEKRPSSTSHTSKVEDMGNLRPLFNHLISLAGENEDKIIYARKLLEDGIQTNTVNSSARDIPKIYGSITRFHYSNTQSIDIGNPVVARTKGCGHGGRPPKKSKRFISRRESNVLKQKSCSIYGIKGHDKRSCPSKEQIFQQE